MRLSTIIDAMETIAPTRFAEDWDNVGLLAGDPTQSISAAMLTIDYTRAVADEAQRLGCDVVIAYHPPIFHPPKRLTVGSLVFDAIRRGVAIYSPHTALDSADGGTNDVLADALGLESWTALKLAETGVSQLKLVTFVPESAVERVSRALFDAGAGRIGNYSSCSFRSTGTGTFFGKEGTKPMVGEERKARNRRRNPPRNRHSDQHRRRNHRGDARVHPYEEPAFDLVSLAAYRRAVEWDASERLPSRWNARSFSLD